MWWEGGDRVIGCEKVCRKSREGAELRGAEESEAVEAICGVGALDGGFAHGEGEEALEFTLLFAIRNHDKTGVKYKCDNIPLESFVSAPLSRLQARFPLPPYARG